MGRENVRNTRNTKNWQLTHRRTHSRNEINGECDKAGSMGERGDNKASNKVHWLQTNAKRTNLRSRRARIRAPKSAWERQEKEKGKREEKEGAAWKRVGQKVNNRKEARFANCAWRVAYTRCVRPRSQERDVLVAMVTADKSSGFTFCRVWSYLD